MESRTVQMRLPKKALDRIDNLKKLTNNNNRTQLVSSSIEIAEDIIGTIKRGGAVYLQSADEKKEQLRILGL